MNFIDNKFMNVGHMVMCMAALMVIACQNNSTSSHQKVDDKSAGEKSKTSLQTKSKESNQKSKDETAATQQAHKGDHKEEHKGDHHGMATLPVEKRVAFMSGHVVAGLTLYRAGAPDQAAKHLLHPVSETHKAERAGIDALGFTPEVFEAVSKALDAGRPAKEIEPMLQKAEANMTLLQKNAGGKATEIIAYLMDTVNEEYAVGVKKGVITDPGEYQDAFGFSVVALNTAKRMDQSKAKALVTQLQSLVNMWPKGGPLAKSTPKPVKEVAAQTAQVMKALKALP